MTVNCVIIGGNVTRDPEMRATAGGKSVAKFGVALNDGTADKPHATFVDVTAFDKAAEFVGNYVRKGAAVIVEGRLKQDEWQDRNSGQKRTKLEVIANRVQSLRQTAERDDAPQATPPRPTQPAGTGQAGRADSRATSAPAPSEPVTWANAAPADDPAEAVQDDIPF